MQAFQGIRLKLSHFFLTKLPKSGNINFTALLVCSKGVKSIPRLEDRAHRSQSLLKRNIKVIFWIACEMEYIVAATIVKIGYNFKE